MNHLSLTILLIVLINLSGYIYSYLIVADKIGLSKQIQPNFDKDKKYLFSHTYLFVFNVLTLILFVFIAGFAYLNQFYRKPNRIDPSTQRRKLLRKFLKQIMMPQRKVMALVYPKVFLYSHDSD